MPEAFERVLVDHLVRGGTRVSWTMARGFWVDGPWSFQLQVADHGVGTSGDWEDVGTPVVDAFTAWDPTMRLTGVYMRTHYRVVLTAGGQTYASEPAHCFGYLGVKDWLLAREIVRKERLRLRVTTIGNDGWLLKRKQRGATIPAVDAADPTKMVVDPLTGEVVKRHEAISTVGTEYLGGYYTPVPTWIGLEPQGTAAQTSPAGRGTVDELATPTRARVVLFPPVERRDVFVQEGSDQRFEFDSVRTVVEVRSVPLVAECELIQLPFNDVVYRVGVPQ